MARNLILGIILLIFVLISIFIEKKQGIYIKTKKGSEKITLLLSLKSYIQYVICAIALIGIYFIYPNSSVIVKKIFRIVTTVIIFIVSYNMCRPIVISFILNDFSESKKEWKEYYASRNIFKKFLIKIFRINFDGFYPSKTKNRK